MIKVTAISLLLWGCSTNAINATSYMLKSAADGVHGAAVENSERNKKVYSTCTSTGPGSAECVSERH